MVDAADLIKVSHEPATLVPPNRLGQLLAEARLGKGADLAELAERSDGDFTIGELSDLEAGHRLLDEQLVRDVTTLYEIGCGTIIPQRAELTIDLDKNFVSASGTAVPLDNSARDHILDRYLSLLYLLRNRDPGTEIPLRNEDLAILAASLAERSELIEEQLLSAMMPEDEAVNRLTTWFRTRLWVPGAGALVGAVSVGTLVIVTSDPGTATETIDRPEPDIGRFGAGAFAVPLVESTTAPSSTVGESTTSTASSTSATSSTSTAAAQTEIGEAASLLATTSTFASSTASSTGTSNAPTTVAASTPADIGLAAEALLPFEWLNALPGWEVRYRGPNSSFRGLTFPYDKVVEIYVRGGETPESVAGILAHELGHAIDVTHFVASDRDDWLDARGIQSSPWWPSAYANDFQAGAGDFAEAFAYWAVGDPSSSEIGGNPSAAQLDVLRSLVTDHL